MWLALLLFLPPVTSPDLPPPREVQLARLHLKLREEPLAYLLVSPPSVGLYMQGLPLKELPVEQAEGLRGSRWRLASVAAVTPAGPVPRVVVDTRQIQVDPSGQVASLAEVVSVSDMPDSFLIRLSDGSGILVLGSPSSGFLRRLRVLWLRVRAAYFFLFSRLRNSWARMGVLLLDRAAAQQLFWHLEPAMKVIY